ncbi:MAG: hypothetical protein WC859_05690 [Elusimicrobiota bacterium]
MNTKTYLLVTGVIFSVVALLHGFRVMFRWEVFIRGEPVSQALSLVGFFVAGFLAIVAFRLYRRL